MILVGWIHELILVRISCSLALPRSLGLSEQSLDRKGSGKMERENERVEVSSLSAVFSPLFRRIGRDESSAWGMRKREHAYLLWTDRGLLDMAPLLPSSVSQSNVTAQESGHSSIPVMYSKDPYYVLPWSMRMEANHFLEVSPFFPPCLPQSILSGVICMADDMAN